MRVIALSRRRSADGDRLQDGSALGSRAQYNGAAGVDRADAVQRVWIGDRVAVDGEDVGAGPGCDAALAVPEPADVGRVGGDRRSASG